MSLLLSKLQLTTSLFRPSLTTKVIPVKFIHSTFVKYNNIQGIASQDASFLKDRSKIIPVEISIQYLTSSAYKQTYGDEPVWRHYRRNFKGQYPPKKTRKMCIRGGVVSTGSPCPICRDEYLILDYRNINLLKQFISEYDGKILNYNYTAICQKAYKDLLVAITKARELGLLTYDVPYIYYNYEEWNN